MGTAVFTTLPLKHREAVFRQLASKLNDTQQKNPQDALDEDWFARQLVKSAKKTLKSISTTLSAPETKYSRSLKSQFTWEEEVREKASLHVDGAKATIKARAFGAERDLATRTADGLENVVRRFTGDLAPSQFGFTGPSKQSFIQQWITGGDNPQQKLKESEIEPFRLKFKEKAAGFVHENHHWPREIDWKSIANEAIIEVREQ